MRVDDIWVAASLLSRLPVPPHEHGRGAAAVWAYPLVGVVVGAISGTLFWALTWAGIPALIGATLAIATMVVLTGALHEDGLADTADGMGAYGDGVRRLEIMRDSHIGVFGTLALIFSVALRVLALGAFGGSEGLLALLTAAVLSRAAMPTVMASLAPASASGLGASTGRAPWMQTAIALIIAFAVALAASGTSGALIAGATLVVTWASICWWSARKLGGFTGDTLGATQQIAEIGVLVSLATLHAP